MEQTNRKYIAIIAFLRKFMSVFFSLFFNIYILKLFKLYTKIHSLFSISRNVIRIHITKNNKFKKCQLNIHAKFYIKCSKHFYINNIQRKYSQIYIFIQNIRHDENIILCCTI